MFGRSKKKQAQAAAQTPQMQVSPEALALLQAMQAQQQMAQQQMVQQQMVQQQMGQPMMQQPAMQQPMMQQPAGQQPMMQQPVGQDMPAQGSQAGIMSDQDLLAELGGAPAAQMQAQAQMPDAMQSAMPQMAQQAPQMSPQMPQQMPQQVQQAEPVMTSQPNAFAFADGGQPQMVPEEPAQKTKKSKLTKDEKRQLAEQKKADKERKKAEKKAQLAEKAEEKKRAKRRKKLAKTRFSRARYLREANGNAVAGAILWVFMILAFIIGPFLLNTGFLIPKTNENLRILSEAKSLERSIITNRPQITAMSEKRKQKNNQIESFKTSFASAAQSSAALQELATALEEAGLEVAPVSIANTPLQAQSILGASATYTVTGNYLDWLRVRNKFVRGQSAISVPLESVGIDDETQQMKISAQFVIPSRL